jgi:hypothetical protein
MKRFLIFPFLFLSLNLFSQVTPLVGDRLFISADRTDSLWIKFIGDSVFFRPSHGGFSKFKGAIMADSIRLSGHWYKSISYSLPLLSVKMVNDSLLYEMTTNINPYNLKLSYSITRPIGCPLISSLKVDGITKTLPVINEGKTVSGEINFSFPGPANPEGLNKYVKNIVVSIAAGSDTVKQSIRLIQAWKIYAYPQNLDEQSTFYTPHWLSGYAGQIKEDGTGIINNINAAGYQLVVGIPNEYIGNQKIINGIVTNFFMTIYPSDLSKFPALDVHNFVNKRGAAHKYYGFYTPYKYKSIIQKFEIQ